MFSRQVETNKVYHRKAYKVLFKKKYLPKFFIGWSFFHEILQNRTISPFRFYSLIKQFLVIICNGFRIRSGSVVWCSINIKRFVL